MTVTWEELGWERLSDRVGRVRLPGWDCTVGLVATPTGALMIDAGSSLPEGTRLRTEAAHLTGVNVTHLALTHSHFDHVLGAAAFPEAKVFAASPAYDAAELTTDAVRNGLPPHLAEEATARLITPDHVVRGTWQLRLGGTGDGDDAGGPGAEAVAGADDGGGPGAGGVAVGKAVPAVYAPEPLAPVDVLLARLGPAHSPDDLVVLVRPEVPGSPPVVFCGDLVEESGEPQAGPDAVPGRWPGVLDALLELGGADALYVPGHGAVVDAEFVRRQRDALRERFGVSHG
ncbi:MBL fold metallo-hydrolase [Streptomyces sp. NPDC004539]|uniref:MBL fold metallo-hydrolase n=1 Tax=Streptomyces sp. NPDC004539 TaxID=3154280 RepID=UPI0033B0C482